MSCEAWPVKSQHTISASSRKLRGTCQPSLHPDVQIPLGTCRLILLALVQRAMAGRCRYMIFRLMHVQRNQYRMPHSPFGLTTLAFSAKSRHAGLMHAVDIALQVYVGRIRKYVGAYMLKLCGKVDAIVVAGGAGEASSDLRQRVFSGMEVTAFRYTQSNAYSKRHKLVADLARMNRTLESIIRSKKGLRWHNLHSDCTMCRCQLCKSEYARPINDT